MVLDNVRINRKLAAAAICPALILLKYKRRCRDYGWVFDRRRNPRMSEIASAIQSDFTQSLNCALIERPKGLIIQGKEASCRS
jgi:hypothetical protein